MTTPPRTVTIPREPLVIDIDATAARLRRCGDPATADAIEALHARVVKLEAAAKSGAPCAMSVPAPDPAPMFAHSVPEDWPTCPPASPPSPRPGVVEIGGGWTLHDSGNEVAIRLPSRQWEFRDTDGPSNFITGIVRDELRSLARAARLGFSMQPRRFDPKWDRDERYLNWSGRYWLYQEAEYISHGSWIITMPPAPEEAGDAT